MKRMKISDSGVFPLCLFVTIGLIISSLVSPAQAFNPKYAVSKTIDLKEFGLSSFKITILGTPHTSQTKNAINLIYSPFFGISDPEEITATMKHAREEIADACAGVDHPSSTEKNLPAAHFDGEQFVAGQERLLDLRRSLVEKLKNGQGSGARDDLGRLLHTLQDFYSHSNWVELNNMVPNNQLGREGGKIYNPDGTLSNCKDCVSLPSEEARLEWERNNQCLQDCNFGDHNFMAVGKTSGCLLAGMAAAYTRKALPSWAPGPLGCEPNECKDNLIDDQHLTSGYYGGQSVTKTNPNKCSHGGAFDSGAKGLEGINKDTTSIFFSPHYYLHEDAVEVSTAATTDFLLDLGEQLSDAERRLLFGVGPELGFVIDVSGSMGSIIASVRAAAIQIVKDRKGTVNEPAAYILAPFNDPPILGPAITEIDPDKFSSQIMGLKASGGGWNCPEYAMQGLDNAIKATSNGGSVFLFTDAGAMDVSRANEVATLARDKGVKVFPFIFPGPCSTSEGYDLVADFSGGQVLSLKVADAGKMTKLADAVSQANFIELFKVKVQNDLGLLRRASESHSFNVDPGMTQLTFSLSGISSLEVRRPDGSNVTESDPNVSVVHVTGATLFIINSPVSGFWSTVTGPGNYSLSVFGAGVLHFITFDFVELSGSNGHFGSFPIRDRGLVAYEELPVMATLDGNFKTAHFEFRSSTGALLSAFDLEPGTGETNAMPANTFSGDVTVPNSDFYVYVMGEDDAGAPYQRVYPRLFTPILSNSTMGSNSTHTNTTVSVAPLYPNTTTTATIINTVGCTSCAACSHGGACSSFDKGPNYPTSTINLDDYLTKTVWVKTITTSCPVVNTVVVGSSTKLETSYSLSTLLVTTTETIPCTTPVPKTAGTKTCTDCITTTMAAADAAGTTYTSTAQIVPLYSNSSAAKYTASTVPVSNSTNNSVVRIYETGGGSGLKAEALALILALGAAWVLLA